MTDQMLSIGEVAARTGLAVSAIRFYQEKGLVKPARTAGGQRQFHRADIRRLSFAMIAQQFGFTIGQISQVLGALPAGRAPTKRDWARIGRAFQGELDAKIATLTRLRNNLDGCIGCGCLSLKRCALYNPGDRARVHGAGPRFLMGDDPEPPVGNART